MEEEFIYDLNSTYVIDRFTYDFNDHNEHFMNWLFDHHIQFRDDDGVEFYIENRKDHPQEEEKTDYLTILVMKRKLAIGFFDEERSIYTTTEVDKLELQCKEDDFRHAPYINYAGFIGDRLITHGSYYFVEGNYIHGF